MKSSQYNLVKCLGERIGMKKALPQIKVIELNKSSASALKNVADCIIKIATR